jgi:hypothetical protein
LAFRKTLDESLDQLRADLDCYLEFSNLERAHQCYRTQGRTRYQGFLAGRAMLATRDEGNHFPEEVTA